MSASHFARGVKRVIPGFLALWFFGALSQAPKIPVEFWYDQESAQLFGGEAGIQSLAEIEMQVHNSVLGNSGMEGYETVLVTRADHPKGYGVRQAPKGIDALPCDLSKRLAAFLYDKAVAAQRNKDKASVVVLLTQCRGEVNGYSGLAATVPTKAADLKNPVIGFMAVMTGALGERGGYVFSHEFGHVGGGNHPPNTAVVGDVSRAVPTVWGFGKGIQFPPRAPGQLPETDVMGAGVVRHLAFYSNPRMTDTYGRRMGVVQRQDMVRLLKANWPAMAKLGQIPWNPPAH